jgi:GNAT superfamily N-acetyltransferase
MLVRPAVYADHDLLYRLAQEFDGLGAVATSPRAAFVARLAEILGRDDWLVLIADDATAGPVGFALAQDYGSVPQRAFATGRPHDLFVTTTFRRRGVARDLMDGVVAWCRQRPLPLILDWQSRADAVPFYESLGLVKDTVGDFADYPGFCLDFRSGPA